MSATLRPTPRPALGPQQVTPAVTPPEAGRPARPPRWLYPLLAAVVLAGAYAAYRFLAAPEVAPAPAGKAVAAAPIRTAKVQAGTFSEVLRLSGQTAATTFANVTAPILRGPESRRGLVLLQLAAAGSVVNPGDIVAEMDKEAALEHIDGVVSTIQQSQADTRKREAEQSISWASLSQTVNVAKSEADKARLDASAAEVRTEIERELIRLSAEEATAQHKQVAAELDTTKAKFQAELRILELTTKRHEMHRDRHLNDLQRFTVASPIRGLVVMQQIWRSGQFAQVQIGDQLNPGQPFMKIVDTSHMQIQASVNQAESAALRIGQKASVGLDAFPEVKLSGRVYSIGALAARSWRENYFIRNIPVVIEIEGSHPKLIPDLSAWANVEVSRKEHALIVPVEALHSAGGKTHVFVKNGDRFERREVQTGGRTFTHAEILSGLQPGEEVALEPPVS